MSNEPDQAIKEVVGNCLDLIHEESWTEEEVAKFRDLFLRNFDRRARVGMLVHQPDDDEATS